jgi:hypothetical protein
MSDWISVKDRLPKWGDEVLALVDGHRGPSWCNIYPLVVYRSRFDGQFYEERHDEFAVHGVLYWMPIPEKPQ